MLTKSKQARESTDEGFEYLASDLDFRTLLSRQYTRSGMSYSGLADAVHRDVAYVYRLLNGERQHPSPNTVIRLALALKLTVLETDELLLSLGYAPLVLPSKPREIKHGSRTQMD